MHTLFKIFIQLSLFASLVIVSTVALAQDDTDRAEQDNATVRSAPQSRTVGTLPVPMPAPARRDAYYGTMNQGMRMESDENGRTIRVQSGIRKMNEGNTGSTAGTPEYDVRPEVVIPIRPPKVIPTDGTARSVE